MKASKAGEPEEGGEGWPSAIEVGGISLPKTAIHNIWILIGMLT